jgi:hypothetical protein
VVLLTLVVLQLCHTSGVAGSGSVTNVSLLDGDLAAESILNGDQVVIERVQVCGLALVVLQMCHTSGVAGSGSVMCHTSMATSRLNPF